MPKIKDYYKKKAEKLEKLARKVSDERDAIVLLRRSKKAMEKWKRQ